MVKLPPWVIAISKAKSVAQQHMKYLGSYLEGVATTFDERVPTMAVDSVGRLYVNPQWCLQWSAEQNGYVLLHEMLHNLLDHAARRMEYLPNPTPDQLEKWNIAADLCIQQVLMPFDGYRPSVGVKFEDYAHIKGMQRGLSTEKYFSLLSQHEDDGGAVPPPPGRPDPDAPDGEVPSGGGGGDEQQDGDNGPGSGDDADGEQDGDGSDAGGGNAKGKGTRKQGHTQSGSASDGIPQDYELEKDMASVGANLARLEEVREQMEKDPHISIGSGMGTVRESLNRRLRRQPDPFDRLRNIVGQHTAAPMGTDEPTYRRRNRRQECDDLPIAGVIRFSPECVIIIDTSGSMGNPKVSDRAARAMTAISQGLRRVQNPRVIAWDGGLRCDKRISSLQQFEWIGGGGTSMDEAVVMADQKYRPEAIVLVTDCGTSWPEKRTRAKLIVAMVDKYSPPPKWAIPVDLTVEAKPNVG